ncbi:MAG TPA: hypothetical protein PLP42_14820 [Acidobacteriota bacterium]|jgi:hypothetical protein|nr:hypothetical protein [Acidobacteriota bacterium]HRR55488.1 hypothetical protein [Acidobacteriota bacterium]HRV07081.1 hypothetical protein [Acidobacteriota bacterium]HXK61157.1 hypothetical protein [Acidobacteriota bacterium]
MGRTEIQPGRQVKITRRDCAVLTEELMVIEQFPIKGLYREYVKCRSLTGRVLYFLPEELSFVGNGTDQSAA